MKTSFDRIDDLLGLHQELSITYVVDGYDAVLRNEEAYPEFECAGHGDTIFEALVHLNNNLLNEVPSNWMAVDLKMSLSHLHSQAMRVLPIFKEKNLK